MSRSWTISVCYSKINNKFWWSLFAHYSIQFEKNSLKNHRENHLDQISNRFNLFLVESHENRWKKSQFISFSIFLRFSFKTKFSLFEWTTHDTFIHNALKDWREKNKTWKRIWLVVIQKDKLHTLLYVACVCSLSSPEEETLSFLYLTFSIQLWANDRGH